MKKVFIWATQHADIVWRRCFEKDFEYKGQIFVPYADIEAYYIKENIELCKSDPEYAFMIESVAVIKKFLERNPEYESILDELVKNGQIKTHFTGCNIVDSNMVCGEGIIRNFLYGYEYLKNKYNITPYVMDRNDAFGNSAQLPQIARKFGTKWITNITYSLPDKPYWKGLDGSCVLTWKPTGTGYTGGYYKYPPCPQCGGHRDIDCHVCQNKRIDIQFMENMRRKLPEELMVADDEIPRMIYCGGEEIIPNSHILEWKNKNKDKYDIKFIGFDDYIPYINDMLNKVDNVGESEVHSSSEINCNNTGTYVTRINTKKTVRENENGIMSLETIAVADFLDGAEYPYNEIEKIWDKYFFTIFHDAVTATHVDAAYDEIMDCAKDIKACVRRQKEEIVSRHKQKNDDYITVYNPYGSELSSDVTVEIISSYDVYFVDEKGENVSIAKYENNNGKITVTFLVSNIDAYSKKIYRIMKTDSPPKSDIKELYRLNEYNGTIVLTNERIENGSSNDINETVIENERFKITATNRGIKEIYDKKLGKTITLESEYMVGEWILEHDEGSPWATHSPDLRRQKMSEYTHLASIEETDTVKKLNFIIKPGDIDGNAVLGLKIKYSVILRHKSDKVEFSSDVFWHTQNYRLRIAMPAKGHSRHFYDIPYGVIERRPYENDIVFPSGATNWASAAGDYPAINWAGIEKEDYSLILMNKGTPSYQINEDSNGNSVIYLSVLRSPSIGSYLYSPTEYEMTDYDGMRDGGTHHFDYAIKAYDSGFDENSAVIDGIAYNAQILAVQGDFDLPDLPKLICNDARISSIKMSQDHNGIVVRICEYHGKDTSAVLEIPENILCKAAYETDLKEDKITRLELLENKVNLVIKHFEIKTVYLEF